MIATTQAVRDYLQRDSRRFFSRFLYNGIEISGSLRSMTINKGSCGESSFTPQSVFSSFVNAEIDYCTDSLTGKKIEVQIGVELDGVKSWYTVATVYASKPSKKGVRTTFEGLGVISAKLGKKFSGGTYTTVSSLLTRLEEVAGCTITLGDGLNDLAIPEVDLSKYYYREVLKLVAGLYFGYATETTDGNIIIKKYGSIDGTITAYPSRMMEDPEFFDIVSVDGIQVIAKDDTEFLVGDLQNCSITNPLMTEEAFNTYINNYVHFQYQPFNLDMSLGDFTIEPWDQIQITDRDGVSHTLYPMSLQIQFDGGLRTTISCPTLDSGEDMSRDEVSMQSNTAYNAVVSGNIETNGGGGGSFGPTAAAYPITGDGITGYMYIENGSRAFVNCRININEGDMIRSTSVGFSAYGQSAIQPRRVVDNTIYFDRALEVVGYNGSLGPTQAYELNNFNLMIPTFTYSGELYEGAGLLHAIVGLNFEAGTYTFVLNFATDYMREQLGELYVNDSTDGTQRSLVGASFDLHFTYLIGASREWEYPNK